MRHYNMDLQRMLELAGVKQGQLIKEEAFEPGATDVPTDVPADEVKSDDSAKGSFDANALFTELFQNRDQVHYWHLQTKSYAEHVALNQYYDAILLLSDAIMEAVIGGYSATLSGGTSLKLDNYESNEQVAAYLNEFKNKIVTYRSQFESDGKTNLANQADEVIQLVDKTVYLLTLS